MLCLQVCKGKIHRPVFKVIYSQFTNPLVIAFIHRNTSFHNRTIHVTLLTIAIVAVTFNHTAGCRGLKTAAPEKFLTCLLQQIRANS